MDTDSPMKPHKTSIRNFQKSALGQFTWQTNWALVYSSHWTKTVTMIQITNKI